MSGACSLHLTAGVDRITLIRSACCRCHGDLRDVFAGVAIIHGASELETGSCLLTQSNQIHELIDPIQSIAIHKYLVLHRTHKLCAINYSNADF